MESWFESINNMQLNRAHSGDHLSLNVHLDFFFRIDTDMGEYALKIHSSHPTTNWGGAVVGIFALLGIPTVAMYNCASSVF